MSLNLHLLRLFAAVARTGSFSRAADLLHISQPAISKGVRDFELQVGCRLLDRTSKGVRPTREGAALARHAETLFAAERAAEDELQALRNLDSGSLRIGASTTIDPHGRCATLHRHYQRNARSCAGHRSAPLGRGPPALVHRPHGRRLGGQARP